MDGYTRDAQAPPEPTRVTDLVVMRHEHVFEVDPALMTEHVRQQDVPTWDTHRMVERPARAPRLGPGPLGRRA